MHCIRKCASLFAVSIGRNVWHSANEDTSAPKWSIFFALCWCCKWWLKFIHLNRCLHFLLLRIRCRFYDASRVPLCISHPCLRIGFTRQYRGQRCLAFADETERREERVMYWMAQNSDFCTDREPRTKGKPLFVTSAQGHGMRNAFLCVCILCVWGACGGSHSYECSCILFFFFPKTVCSRCTYCCACPVRGTEQFASVGQDWENECFCAPKYMSMPLVHAGQHLDLPRIHSMDSCQAYQHCWLALECGVASGMWIAADVVSALSTCCILAKT